jgi:hypothetical protein
MNDFNADGAPDGDGEKRDELSWTEFDWEKYLRQQDAAIAKYLEHYESLEANPDRIDEAARLMGWEEDDWNAESVDEVDLDNIPEDWDDLEPYSVHRNPVFVATKAIFGGLWRRIGTFPQLPDPALSKAVLGLAALCHQAEDTASMAIHALDLGDYAMAVSLFKRTLRALNAALSAVAAIEAMPAPGCQAFAAAARLRLFDLREISLRVMEECRQESARPLEDEG